MHRFVGIVGQLLGNIVTVLFPEVAKLYSAQHYNKLRSLYRRLLLVIIPISLLAFTVLYFAGESVFELWMGDLSFFDQQLFLVFLITNCLMIIGSPAVNFIEAVGWHRYSTMLSLGQGALKLVLCVVLIGKYGTLGVALATLGSLLVTSFAGNIIYFQWRLKALTNKS